MNFKHFMCQTKMLVGQWTSIHHRVLNTTLSRHLKEEWWKSLNITLHLEAQILLLVHCKSLTTIVGTWSNQIQDSMIQNGNIFRLVIFCKVSSLCDFCKDNLHSFQRFFHYNTIVKTIHKTIAVTIVNTASNIVFS